MIFDRACPGLCVEKTPFRFTETGFFHWNAADETLIGAR